MSSLMYHAYLNDSDSLIVLLKLPVCNHLFCVDIWYDTNFILSTTFHTYGITHIYTPLRDFGITSTTIHIKFSYINIQHNWLINKSFFQNTKCSISPGIEKCYSEMFISQTALLHTVTKPNNLFKFVKWVAREKE